MKKAITPYWMMAPGPTLRHAWLHHPPRLAGMVVPVLRGVGVSRMARLSAQILSNMTIPWPRVIRTYTVCLLTKSNNGT